MTFFGKLCTSGAAGLAALLVSQASAGVVCLGDLNGDNQVDAADLAILLGAWGTPNADLTGDGTTNGADLAVLLGAWGPCPPPSVCPNPEHNCFVTGTAGCSDEDCCNAVCAADPFCCNNQWDGICVNGALDLCGSESCGTSAGNDCCTESTVPGCNDEICCNIVCTADPFCCATQWDSLCVSEAEKLCGIDCGDDPACGVPGTGDCCEANGTPFCDDAECCNLICASDPFCCNNQWDGICANAAIANCGVCAPDPACGVPGTGDCCEANGTPFCDDAECCNLVCAADPFCCTNEWDQLCANQAIADCGVCGSSVCPNPEHGCFVTGTAGCSDEACCNAVCAADPFCCATSWDNACVSGALNLCGSESCGAAAGNDCCTTSAVPGCNDEVCCNIVCVVDPFCCATAWDSACVGGAEKLCGLDCTPEPACGVPGTGDCCEANGTPFCDDAECCALICAADAFCCTTAWDTICANAALAQCAACAPDPACGVPGTGNCCEANGTPFCDDAECCNLVCAADPFCCNNQWDQVCANQAIADCGVCGGGVCPNPEHNCFVTGTAGCSDEACCNAVCAADPFCCANSWDNLCVTGANDLCGNAACPNPAHDCFTPGSAGCSDETCCNNVCSFDPFCCSNQWDTICVNNATTACQ